MDNPDKLIQLKRAAGRAKKISAGIEQAKTYREALEQKIKALKESCFKEENEVSILEEDKALAFILSLRGKLGERMEKEKAESLALKLKYQEAQDELVSLDGKISALVAELADLSDCEPEYEQLYERKRQRFIREGNSKSRKIMGLSECTDRTNNVETIGSEVFCDVLKLRQFSDETQDSIDSLEAQLDALVLGAEE